MRPIEATEDSCKMRWGPHISSSYLASIWLRRMSPFLSSVMSRGPFNMKHERCTQDAPFEAVPSATFGLSFASRLGHSTPSASHDLRLLLIGHNHLWASPFGHVKQCSDVYLHYYTWCISVIEHFTIDSASVIKSLYDNIMFKVSDFNIDAYDVSA